jgi:cytochrome c551
MGREWRPLVVGGAVVVTTFALAQARVFEPSAPAESTVTGDVTRGEAVFQAECSGCHGDGGTGAAGPPLFETGLDATEVATAVQQGRGIMPAGIVSGLEQADVVAYVVSISRPAQ